MEWNKMELWKKTETIGCIMDDGSNTRKIVIRFFLIGHDEKEQEEFSEYMANDYGYTDYSYQPNYEKIERDFRKTNN
jgi:hypothetical protein